MLVSSFPYLFILCLLPLKFYDIESVINSEEYSDYIFLCAEGQGVEDKLSGRRGNGIPSPGEGVSSW